MAGKRTAKREDPGRGKPSSPPASEVSVAAEPVVVALPADCRMAAQAALKNELLAALDADSIVLDGRAVDRIDTAALQLLLLFRRERDARGGACDWDGSSAALNEAADLLGLTPLLKLPAIALA